MKTVIFANGEIENYDFVKRLTVSDDYIICCDGGTRHAFIMGVRPDVILGDMDSVDTEMKAAYKNDGVQVIVFPAEKDFTDLELAIDFALSRGTDEIQIFGGLGGRFDHELANVHALVRAAEAGVKAFLIDIGAVVAVTCNEYEIKGENGDIVSLIPLSGSVSGVTTEGLYYPLNAETLKTGSTRGVSNVMLTGEAKVTVEAGWLAVIVTKQGF